MQKLRKAFLCMLVFAVLYSIGAVERTRELRSMQRSPVAYAYVQQLDPVFAYPGSTIESLKRAIGEFRTSASVAVPPFPEGQNIREAMFPFNFLEHIPTTEAAREQLISDPTREHAVQYHTALSSLISSYISDLHTARTVLWQGGESSYIFLSGTTTNTHVETQLARAEAHAHALLEKENRRWQCLQTGDTGCESLAHIQLNFGITNIAAPGHMETPNEVIRNKDLLTAVYPTLTSSPIVELTTSACYTYAPTYYAVARATSRLSGIPSVDIVLLSDIYLDDVTRTEHPLYVALKNAGAHFTYQPFNVYLCPDAGEDIGDVLDISKLSEELRVQPFVLHGLLPPLVEQFKQAQDQLVQEPVYTQHAHDAFLAAASELVRFYDNDTLTQYIGTRADVVRLTEMVTESRARSAGFDTVLGYFDDLQIGSSLPYQFKPSPPQAFLIARGGLSQLFALSNRTVQNKLNSLMTTRSTSTSQEVIRSYKNDVHTELSPEALQQVLIQDMRVRDNVFGTKISSLIQSRALYIKTH